MESSKSNRWHGGSCCEASLTWRPSGPCWLPLSTCAPCGGPGAPAPSSTYHTGQISIPLPDPNCAGNHPSPIHPHLQLSRQESFSKSHRLKPSAPTYYPLHHFWDRLNSVRAGPPKRVRINRWASLFFYLTELIGRMGEMRSVYFRPRLLDRQVRIPETKTLVLVAREPCYSHLIPPIFCPTNRVHPRSNDCLIDDIIYCIKGSG